MSSAIPSSQFPDHPLSARARTGASDGDERRDRGSPLNNLDWRQALGAALMAGGALAIAVAWWQISGTPNPGEQMPPFASGGLGGAAAIAIGVLLLNSFEHKEDREALHDLLDRIDQLEARALGNHEHVIDEVRQLTQMIEERDGSAKAGSNARSRPPRRTKVN